MSRVFPADAPLPAVFCFVELQEEMAAGVAYEIVAQYPRRSWRPRDGERSLSEAGLRDGDTLYVQEPLPPTSDS